MYEKIAGLRFKGAAFTDETTMAFFPSNEKSIIRAALIFGKNGSGKSTISKAVLKSCHSEIPEIQTAYFLDGEDNKLEYSDADLRHVFVFNEDYIERNIRLRSDGLDTIVMLGDQGNLEDKIKTAESDLHNASIARQAQADFYQKYEDRTAVTAPAFYISQMVTALKGDDHWAGRERIINGSRTNASVKDNTYKKIISVKPMEEQKEIRAKYDAKLIELKTAADDSAKIRIHVPVEVTLNHTEKEINDLLAVKLQKPELSEREKYLLALVEAGKTDQLERMHSVFSDPARKMCPYCLQDVDKQYKAGLIESIHKVLSKEVEEHRVALKAVSMTPVELNLSAFASLDTNVLQKCNECLDSLNAAITACATKLSEKDEDVYLPIVGVSFQLEEKRQSLIASLRELEKCREAFNTQFDSIKDIRDTLHVLNYQLSYFEIEGFYATYIKQKAEQEQEKKKLDSLIAAEKEKQKVYTDLIQQKKSVRIAVDVINHGLQYVFFSKERLLIEAKDDVYTLSSNGHSVKPSDVSSGERNIIALCYFFTEIMKNLDTKDVYAQECFLVIDDPVSSFDLENRIGILSFLKSQMLHIFSGNKDSKIFVMTHDLPTFYDLEKILGEIKDATKEKFGKGKMDYRLFELTNKTLVEFKERKRNEYSELLSAVYEYAAGTSNEYDLVIGNIMRRTLEAFSTFEYKKGMDAISCDEKILLSMNNCVYSSYFKNLMYRLVLNGESHMEEKVKSLTDDGFSSYLTYEQKQKTAKDVLCLINILNPAHVAAHLSEIPNAITNIKEWCQSILELNK